MSSEAIASGSEIEIGAVRHEELEILLSLLCAAFELPLEAARSIFYTDPYFVIENKRVLRVDGHLVSSLTVVPTTCRIGEGLVKIAGIAAVATAPMERRKGYAAILLRETLNYVKSLGFGLAALLPSHKAYYERLGWEAISQSSRRRYAVAKIARCSSWREIRPAAPGDVSQLLRLYLAHCGGRSLACLRDEKRWHYLLRYMNACVVFEARPHVLDGYAIYALRAPETWGGQTGGTKLPAIVSVLEVVGRTDNARESLARFLAEKAEGGFLEQSASIPDLNFWYPYWIKSGQEVQDGEGVEAMPGLMGYITDWMTLITSLSANWVSFAGILQVQIQGVAEGTNLERLRIDCRQGTTPQITRSDSTYGDPTPLGNQRLPTLTADARTWAKLVTGYIGIEEAAEQGHLSPSSIEALAAGTRLFPKRAPFLAPPDHF